MLSQGALRAGMSPRSDFHNTLQGRVLGEHKAAWREGRQYTDGV
jgi:hypothetical protein